jgi:predicted amidohydrolase
VFRDEVINKSKTRVLAMLNIVGSGMGGRMDVEQNVRDMDPERTAETAKTQRRRGRHQDRALCRPGGSRSIAPSKPGARQAFR